MNQQVYTKLILSPEDVVSEDKCVQAITRIIFSALNVDSRLIKEVGSHPLQFERLSRRFVKAYALGFHKKVAGSTILLKTAADLGIPILVVYKKEDEELPVLISN